MKTIRGNNSILGRAMLAGVAAIAIAAGSAPAMAQSGRAAQVNVPAQSMSSALNRLGRQTNTEIVFAPAAVRGLRAPALQGNFTVDQALGRLLAGSGLGSRRTGEGAIVVERGSGEAPAGGAAADSGSADQDIVVVGTNIRGIYPSSSPVQTYSAEDIARTAATTTEQFIERIPQNLGTRTQYAAGTNSTALGRTNLDGVSAVDLRGLGAGTTLTLLNGRRLSAANSGESTDVSLIPLGAIERVEVLTDGASAIYGSDAIGGVVNFVLRHDFNGLETRASYGGTTEGGLRQRSASQMFGRGWNTGNLIVSYNVYSASPLDIFDRDYAVAAGAGTLTPDDTRQNVFATVTQRLGERLTIGATGTIALRDVSNVSSGVSNASPSGFSKSEYDSSTIQVFGDLSADYAITGSLAGSLRATYSNLSSRFDARTVFYNLSPPVNFRTRRGTNHSVLDLTAKLDGTLFTTGAGDARFSIGGGRLEENYEGVTFASQSLSRALGRATNYAFAEIFVPIVRRSQHVPLIDRLEVSLAGRFTNYEDTSDPQINQDFGSAFDPKVGLLWAPFEGLNLRGTYGKAFRAPNLPQLDPTGGLSSLATLPIAGVPGTLLLLPGAPVPNLRPETADTFTLGFDLRPRRFPGFQLSATYYNISYTDRILQAPGASNVFTNPELFPDRIYRPTSVGQVEALLAGSTFASPLPGVDRSNLAAVAAALFARPNLWIYDNRYRNLSLSEQDGLDFSISNRFRTSAGDLNLGATLTYILNYRQQSSPASPVVSAVGSVRFPVDLRGRAFATYSVGGFSGTLSLNYVDDFVNPAFNNERVDSWTTLDLSLSYSFSQTSGPLSGLRISLSAQNLTDEDPPFVRYSVGNSQPGFDSTNANPLGRFVVLSVAKRW